MSNREEEGGRLSDAIIDLLPTDDDELSVVVLSAIIATILMDQGLSDDAAIEAFKGSLAAGRKH